MNFFKNFSKGNFLKKDFLTIIMIVLTIILSISYILNGNFVSLLILYLFTSGIYLVTKKLLFSLLIAILLVSIFVSSGLLNFREGHTNKKLGDSTKTSCDNTKYYGIFPGEHTSLAWMSGETDWETAKKECGNYYNNYDFSGNNAVPNGFWLQYYGKDKDIKTNWNCGLFAHNPDDPTKKITWESASKRTHSTVCNPLKPKSTGKAE
jgi:hypothetical protein